ncbi:unnamed protein product [Cylicocyclus nassatus]|uniref:Uncharacterized protein n=1 Tax=Cylicocyclus nassatus TaxID=53992 RepID=A0AA36MGN6_CYLNA|nr:unnamed protein product [Cylicocyclus nassatus]
MFYVRVIIGSIVLLSCVAVTLFLVPWVIYSSEWRLEQTTMQDRFLDELKWEQSRSTLSNQVTKAAKEQKLPKTEIEDIIVRYLDNYLQNAVRHSSSRPETTYWTYPSSIWFVVCQIMSVQPLRNLEIFSVVTHLLSLYYKLLGPSVAVLIIASMAATITWIFTVMLPCVLQMPKDLAQCLTSAYQKRLMTRDLIVMTLSLCYFVGVTILCASLYSSHSGTDTRTTLGDLLAMMSLTTLSGKEVYGHGTKNSIMEALYWSSLLFLTNSALAAAFASIIRAYCTWLNSDEVIATPEELLASLEKEKRERRNQLIYHDKSE